MQDQLAETKERYRQGSGGVTERTRTLAEVTILKQRKMHHKFDFRRFTQALNRQYAHNFT